MMRISPVATAQANRLLTTRSIRSIGEWPYAVALRRKAGLKFSSASAETACSVSILDLAYAVRGFEWIVFVEIELLARAIDRAAGGE